MNRYLRYFLGALLVLLVALSAGVEREPVEKEGVKIYFLSLNEEAPHGPALDYELYSGPSPKDGNPVPGPRALIYALLAGPRREGLTSPFPRGVTLESWRWDPDLPGSLQVRLSEQYSGLADIYLTMADYCVVLTLSQLPLVETVEIISGGYTAAYRSHQVLSAEEVLMSDELACAEQNIRQPDALP